MKTIDLTPLYRNSVGFDRVAAMLETALRSDSTATGYPPYNIEVLDEDRYAITIAVAGFKRNDLDVQVEQGILTIKGNIEGRQDKRYLHQGIANRSFERRFNLADHVEVTGADLLDGLLTVQLVRIIPEAMKPRTIVINQSKT